MNEIRFNLHEFTKDTDASVIVSFMMASNDIERMVKIREMLGVERTDQPNANNCGSFDLSLNSYTANVLIGHVCEAYNILQKIEGEQDRPIHSLLESNAGLKSAYAEACHFIDRDVDSKTGTSKYSALLRKWRDLRDSAVFHYDKRADQIPAALLLVAQTYGYSTSFIGESKEPTFHELGYEVIDAIGSEVFCYRYGDESKAADLVNGLKPLIACIRKLSHALIIEYVNKYRLSIEPMPGAAVIDP